MGTTPQDNQQVQFNETDARRIAKAVKAHERSIRGKKPSRLPRAAGGGGGLIRLAQFTGSWRKESPYNLKVVRLFVNRDQPLTGDGEPSPFDWIPETDSYGDAATAVAINWMAYLPSTPGDTIRWCAITQISELSGEYDTGIKTVAPDDPSKQVPVMKPFTGLWLLIAAEC